MSEMGKLAEGLDKRGITFTMRIQPYFNTPQIMVNGWDAICNPMSFGNKDGLLEVMGNIVKNDYGNVEGYLTAEEILTRLDKNI